MDTMKAILERRSIRKYREKSVSDEIIRELLKAGMYAPSAGNQQPWDFIVVKNKESLNNIPEFHPYSNMIKEVNVAIIVCGNLEKENIKDFWVQDCSAATQNILLAAHSMDLGAVWLGVYPDDDRVKGVREMFNLPNHIIPLSIIPVGYPAENKSIPDRYKEDSVHYEQW